MGISPKAKVTNPHGPLAIPCANCHSYTSWKPIRSNPEFNHDLTGYPLRGMHQNVGCSKCHTSMVFKNVSSGCADCHADIHRRQFGANCANCHSVKGWQTSLQAIQNHQNRFPLVGAHALVQCEECHKQAAVGQFVGLSTSCYSCHQKDFLTPVLDHVGLGLPNTCESCHSMDSWFNAKFDHLKYTGYPLSGAHATLPCVACHINNVFKGTPAQCYSCHTADFNNSNNPPHVKLGLPRDCAICHSTVRLVQCQVRSRPVRALSAYRQACHRAVRPVPHQQQLQQHSHGLRTVPPGGLQRHHQSRPRYGWIPDRLLLCHTTGGMEAIDVQSQTTKFPLTGAHATVQLRPVPRQQQLLRHASRRIAMAAIRPITRTRTLRHMRLRDSRPPATTCHNTTSWTERDLRPQQDDVPADRRARRPWPAHSAT